MIRLSEAVVVEGKYDKIKLSNFIDAQIITTDGFRIFKDKEKLSVLRKIAEKRGVIILTDSDSAGMLIRGHLRGLLPEGRIKNVYVPEIKGKEKRKQKSSAEGILGVEGLSEQIILKAFENSGVNATIEKSENTEKITTRDLYELGLSGSHNSVERRKALLLSLELPTGLSTSQLLTVLNSLYDREEFIKRSDSFGKYGE